MATYTLRTFLNEVLSYVTPRGHAFSDAPLEQIARINERLYKFCSLTRCLYNDNITFSAQSGTALYDMTKKSGTYGFSDTVIDIDDFWLGGVQLDAQSIQEFREHGNYQAQSGQPGAWAFVPYGERGQIRLFPKPSSNYTDGVVSGHISHPTLTDWTDPIVLPLDYTATAAVYCAIGFLFPGAASASDIEAMRGLNESAASQMQDLIDKAYMDLRGPLVRGLTVKGSKASTTFRL